MSFKIRTFPGASVKKIKRKCRQKIGYRNCNIKNERNVNFKEANKRL